LRDSQMKESILRQDQQLQLQHHQKGGFGVPSGGMGNENTTFTGIHDPAIMKVGGMDLQSAGIPSMPPKDDSMQRTDKQSLGYMDNEGQSVPYMMQQQRDQERRDFINERVALMNVNQR